MTFIIIKAISKVKIYPYTLSIKRSCEIEKWEASYIPREWWHCMGNTFTFVLTSVKFFVQLIRFVIGGASPLPSRFGSNRSNMNNSETFTLKWLPYRERGPNSSQSKSTEWGNLPRPSQPIRDFLPGVRKRTEREFSKRRERERTKSRPRNCNGRGSEPSRRPQWMEIVTGIDYSFFFLKSC